ncbi:MAG: NF038143 family protein [Deltaproteobacteria bacterium]|jgi:hypothetical protein|nr:NF038143 family protein [Deltaproteobacteria bacterium]
MDKYQIIRTAEEQFAREVTLGVMIQRPLPAILYIIPGMFFIEYLRRGTAIRKYTRHFMFPRNLALLTAEAVSRGEDEHEIDARIEMDIRNWLTELGLYSHELAEAQKKSIELIREHYMKLLAAQGDSIHDLIKAAYPSRADYVAYLEALSAAEQEIDGAIVGSVGEHPKLQEKLQLETQQVEKRHKKIMEEIY